MFVSSFHIFSAEVLRVRVQGTRDDVDPQESTAKGELHPEETTGLWGINVSQNESTPSKPM